MKFITNNSLHFALCIIYIYNFTFLYKVFEISLHGMMCALYTELKLCYRIGEIFFSVELQE